MRRAWDEDGERGKSRSADLGVDFHADLDELLARDDVDAVICDTSTDRPANMGWRADKEKIGGGELIDTGYHPTYLMLYFAGAVPVEVTAMLSRHRLSFMDGEDSAQVLVRFEDGKVGHIVTSWAYQAAGCTERFSAVGDEGQLWSDGNTLFTEPTDL